MDKNREVYLKMLYKSTPTTLKKIADIEEVYQKLEKGYNMLTLPKKTKLGGITALHLVFSKFERKYSTISVHWQQNPTISTKQDPFCSIAILRYNTLCKLERILKEMAE